MLCLRKSSNSEVLLTDFVFLHLLSVFLSVLRLNGLQENFSLKLPIWNFGHIVYIDNIVLHYFNKKHIIRIKIC